MTTKNFLIALVAMSAFLGAAVIAVAPLVPETLLAIR
jgi:hypothetical protein